MKESELYPHIKTYLQSCGYEVKSEIADCDILAYKENTVIAIEMKTTLGTRLLAQAVKRQSVFDLVYIAIPKPSYKKLGDRKHNDLLRVIRRLNLGLLYVNIKGKGACQEVFEPKSFSMDMSMRRYQKRRKKAMDDFHALTGDNNIGGTTRVKQMTSYKENSLLIALYLERDGELSPKALRAFGCGDKTLSILAKNYESYFIHVSKGVYGISNAGIKAIEDNKVICDVLRRGMEECDESS